MTYFLRSRPCTNSANVGAGTSPTAVIHQASKRRVCVRVAPPNSVTPSRTWRRASKASTKSETVARYSVLNDRKQIFASKYMLSLPTEEQLRREIERERRLIESALEECADD